MGKKMKIHEREFEKPVYIIAGMKAFVDLEYIVDNDLYDAALERLDKMDREEMKTVVINRYVWEPKDKKLQVGRRSFTIDQIIDEIRNDGEYADMFLEKERMFLKHILKTAKENGIEKA